MDDDEGTSSGGTSACYHADAELRDHLAAQGFVGPDYEKFEREIASYGLGVMIAMIGSRNIVHEISRKKFLGARTLSNNALKFWPDSHDVTDLAIETVRRSLPVFRRKALLDGKWTPLGGASLTTYFVGTCEMIFLDVYKGWLKRRQEDWSIQVLDFAEFTDSPDPTSGGDPLLHVILQERLRESLPENQRQRQIVALHLEGYQYAEIVEIIGGNATVKSVGDVIRKYRKSVQGQSGGASG